MPSFSSLANSNYKHRNYPVCAMNQTWRRRGEVFIDNAHDYDTQNRLTYWGIYKKGVLVKPNTITYDPVSSNITTKSDLGPFTLNYGGKNPNGGIIGRPDNTNSSIGLHALSTISGVPSCFPQVELPTYPTAELSVTYTDFKKIATLSEKNKYYELTYGVDDQRRMSVYKENNVTKETRYYLGNYEEKIDNTTGITQKIHYLSGAILIQETNQPDKFYYTYSDYQGSLIALTDKDGDIKERYAYDPWGVRRNTDDWSQNDSRTTWIVNRGYTGHEHLDAFGIINMNGRVYDPLTAQFFSPDPVLTDAGNWLDYNRYGYCMGNPFRYTDPSGNSWITTVAAVGVFVGVTLLTAGTGAVPAQILAAGILATSASSATSAVLGTALNGGSFGDCFLAGTKGAIFGGASAMATAGIGDIFGSVGDVGNELLRAGAHATAQGGISELSGGNFWQGAAAGAFGSLGGSAFEALGIANSAVGTVAFSALAGGIGAKIAGGDFLEGAATGAIIGLLNHSLHASELKLNKNATAEEIINGLMRKMEAGDDISADELAKINSIFKYAKLGIDRIVRTENGFKIETSGLKTISLKAAGLGKNSEFNVRTLQATDGGKIYQITSPKNTLNFNSKTVPFNIYINNNQLSTPQYNFQKFITLW